MHRVSVLAQTQKASALPPPVREGGRKCTRFVDCAHHTNPYLAFNRILRAKGILPIDYLGELARRDTIALHDRRAEGVIHDGARPNVAVLANRRDNLIAGDSAGKGTRLNLQDRICDSVEPGSFDVNFSQWKPLCEVNRGTDSCSDSSVKSHRKR